MLIDYLKNLQIPSLDICEDSKLIMSLIKFVRNIRHQTDQKLKKYEEKAKSTSVGSVYILQSQVYETAGNSNF